MSTEEDGYAVATTRRSSVKETSECTKNIYWTYEQYSVIVNSIFSQG